VTGIRLKSYAKTDIFESCNICSCGGAIYLGFLIPLCADNCSRVRHVCTVPLRSPSGSSQPH
jgi:hypothetical protein